MTQFAVAFALAFLILLASLIALRRGRNRDMPSQDVIERVKAREKALEAAERAETQGRGE